MTPRRNPTRFTSRGQISRCIPWDASAEFVRAALSNMTSADARTTNDDTTTTDMTTKNRELRHVSVDRGTSESLAPNGYVYTIYYLGTYAQDVPDPYPWSEDGLKFEMEPEGCEYTFADTKLSGYAKYTSHTTMSTYSKKNITAVTMTQGTVHPTNCTESGCLDGVVTRGDLNIHNLISEPAAKSVEIAWNAPAQGIGSMQEAVEAVSTHRVNVTREVIDKYGVVEWVTRFVFNRGQWPPGTGDVADMNVTQDSTIYALGTSVERACAPMSFLVIRTILSSPKRSRVPPACRVPSPSTTTRQRASVKSTSRKRPNASSSSLRR